MNNYRIYLNNSNLADCVDISADNAIVMGTLSLFYIGEELVASIPNHLVFIKLAA